MKLFNELYDIIDHEKELDLKKIQSKINGCNTDHCELILALMCHYYVLENTKQDLVNIRYGVAQGKRTQRKIMYNGSTINEHLGAIFDLDKMPTDLIRLIDVYLDY